MLANFKETFCNRFLLMYLYIIWCPKICSILIKTCYMEMLREKWEVENMSYKKMKHRVSLWHFDVFFDKIFRHALHSQHLSFRKRNPDESLACTFKHKWHSKAMHKIMNLVIEEVIFCFMDTWQNVCDQHNRVDAALFIDILFIDKLKIYNTAIQSCIGNVVY